LTLAFYFQSKPCNRSYCTVFDQTDVTKPLWRTSNTFRGECHRAQLETFSKQLRYLPPVKCWDRKHTQRWKIKVYLLYHFNSKIGMLVILIAKRLEIDKFGRQIRDMVANFQCQETRRLLILFARLASVKVVDVCHHIKVADIWIARRQKGCEYRRLMATNLIILAARRHKY
jgi:hypothetical protein